MTNDKLSYEHYCRHAKVKEIEKTLEELYSDKFSYELLLKAYIDKIITKEEFECVKAFY